MKNTFLALAFLLTAAVAPAAPVKKVAAAPSTTSQAAVQEQVADFKALVATASEPKTWTRVFLHPRNGKWVKQYYFLGQVKFDIKKTDSLLNPAMGLVNFPVEVKLSDFYATEEEAAQSTTLSDLKVTYFYSGKYLFSDSGWHTDQFSYYAAIGDNPPERTTVQLPRERLLQNREAGKEESQWLYKWVR
ncbi:hypothetical protein LK542_02760 [Massilia sp. IC2-477]|uniref:hypothetical protein n=1 Tax=Massilia sp. IC2-477 TaxID=2887198 RepID=UPI001D12A8ED|nr:hypothetical protein [Massilia sp. IC2-477]MCC2954533.1 hypothetical protein [Massilia sp. IC2-477]